MKSVIFSIIHIFRFLYLPILNYISKIKEEKGIRMDIKKLQDLEYNMPQDSCVYYLGITAHVNLGDLAQHYCICKWINENYPDKKLILFESNTVVDVRRDFISRLKKIYKEGDIIIFQSGYTTQDLGGNHELMHRMVINALPEAHILMMPQTIFFKEETNKRLCADTYSKAHHMLFLARDFVSYDMAKNMFQGITIKAYPDIVTTLIGSFSFNHKRDGVCLCTRNDGEKYYSNFEIEKLADRIRKEGIVVKCKDTQSRSSISTIRKNLEGNIESEIESYSYYKVTITDRYHATIFSLCAGTPVIIIKTNDHKVTTGADWFKGVYDDYVFVANDLNEAYTLTKKLLSADLENSLRPCFKREYYDKLKGIFQEIK